MASGTGITPKLSTFDASMIVVSLVIGIGIFRTPAIVASHAGSATMFYVAWILGGVISLFGALTFAEIGSRFPRPGAFYQVVAESYHPAVAFMLNWTSVTIVNGAGGAAVAMIGAEYLTPVLFPPEHRTLLATQVTAAGLAAFLIGVNALGIKTGAWTLNILTVLKVGMIGVLAFAGLAAGVSSSVVSSPAFTLPSSPLLALGLALIPVFYTYGGYQSAINILSIFFLGTFEKLMNYVMLFDAFNNAVVASTIFILRRRNITAGMQPYTVPLYPVLPSLFILVLLSVTVNVILSQPGSFVVGIAFVAAGFPLYLIMQRFSHRRTQP